MPLSKFGFAGLLVFCILGVTFACSTVVLDHYAAPKWLVFYLATVLIAAAGFLWGPTRWHVPPLGLSWILVGLTLLINICTWIAHPQWYVQNHLLRVFSFIVLALFTHEYFVSDQIAWLKLLMKANVAATLGVMLYGFIEVLGYEPFPALQMGEFPISFFGFQNFTAEFLGISILLQIYSLNIFKLCSVQKSLSVALLALTFAYAYVLQCRAVWLGLFLSLALTLVFNRTLRRWIYIGLMASCLLIAVFEVNNRLTPNRVGRSPSMITTNGFSEAKHSTVVQRIQRWKNTWRLVIDHPFGIGPDRYEFEYLPYKDRDPEASEYNLVQYPHNEVLQILAENGIFAGVLWIAFLAVLIGQIIIKSRVIPSESKRIPHLLTLSLFLFLFVVGFFGFPMSNAYPFMIFAIFVGVSLGLLQKSAPRTSRSIALFLGGATVVLTFFFARFAVSKWVETHAASDLPRTARACMLFPENWRVCLREAQLYLEAGEMGAAQKRLEEQLISEPYNFPAVRLLAMVYLAEGNRSRACTTFKRFDQIFGGDTDFYQTRPEDCARP